MSNAPKRIQKLSIQKEIKKDGKIPYSKLSSVALNVSQEGKWRRAELLFALVLLVAKILAGEEHLVKDASLCGISESGKMAVIFLMNNL